MRFLSWRQYFVSAEWNFIFLSSSEKPLSFKYAVKSLSELRFWKDIGRNSSVAMHEVNKMFIDACLEKLVKDGKLSKKTAEEYYGVCLYTYEYKELKKELRICLH